MISNRRRIPYHFAARCPAFPVVERYATLFGPHLPLMFEPRQERYWQCYIGILLCHRELWDACGGYDETFLYYGCMEFDLFLRLRMRYAGLNLGPVVGCDFYHLDHMPEWLPWRTITRRINPVRTPDHPPPAFRPNGPDWGLTRYDWRLEAVDVKRDARELRWRASHVGEFLAAAAASSAATATTILGTHLREYARTRRWRLYLGS